MGATGGLSACVHAQAGLSARVLSTSSSSTLAASCQWHPRAVIYVDAEAAGPVHDGSSWCQGYTELYDALAVATEGTTIRVADGTYKPDVGSVSYPRDATFVLLSAVTIEGGYAGCGASDPDERDIALFETILSGDLNGDDGPWFANNDENALRVVTASGVDETAVLDGFTITAGNANGAGLNSGGGMYIWQGAPTLIDCTFSSNSANTSGGGMYNYSSDLTLTNCTFSGNSAGSYGGGMYSYYGAQTLTNCTFSANSANGDYYSYGGGMYNSSGNPTLTNCTFSGNSASNDGGGMYNVYSDPTLTNCTFSGNRVSGSYGYANGGGMYNSSGDPTLTNCTFSGNSASDDGGGMYNPGRATLTNCTFSGNSADRDGGGMYSNGYYPHPTVTNCILWGNTDSGGHDESAQISGSAGVSYTCIEGWSGSGTGNIGRDPLFVDPDGPDDVIGTPDDDVRLLPFSPCIDAANNEAVPPDTLDLDGDGDTSEPTPLDLAGSPRFLDDPLVIDRGSGDPPIVDMGAFESADCNGNEVPDWEDITSGTSGDCNENAVPDECEIAQGTSADCNENGVPDECDIADGTSADCNDNAVPDECEIAQGTSSDCNENGVPDECDIADGTSADCNDTAVPDECDLDDGTSGDCNENTVPDECEPDDDGDGVINDCDQCPETPMGLIIGDDGCPVPYGPCCFDDELCIDNTESADCALVGGSYLGNGLTCEGDPDGDWAYGCDDGCPLDPNKIEPGICGCGVPDDDADGDGVPDCVDSCPDTEAGLPVNICGCTALGACCFAVDVCWDDVELYECTAIDGVYQGDGSICEEGCAFGDLYGDGDVDLRDFAAFQRCFTGAGGAAVESECQRGDLDGCGAISLFDFVGFRNAFTGPE